MEKKFRTMNSLFRLLFFWDYTKKSQGYNAGVDGSGSIPSGWFCFNIELTTYFSEYTAEVTVIILMVMQVIIIQI